MEISIPSFLDFLGLGSVSGIDILFASMALIGTGLFVLYFLLLIVFGFADGVLEGAFNIDFDMDAGFAFELLTLQGILSFIMMFGIFGLAVNQANDNTLMAIGAGTVAGLISMYIMGKVYHLFRGLESEGNVDHANAVGARGEVYMNIPANGSGQVQVTYQNALRTMAARSKDDAQALPSGTLVQVVDHLGSMLIVEPLDFSSEE